MPLFTGVRGRAIPRSSAKRRSRKSLAITHPPGLQLVMQCAETQSLPDAAARRIGIIVGTGSLSRKSSTILLTNEGFSMKWACDVPGTTASSEFGMARYSSMVCSREMKSSSPTRTSVGAPMRPRSSIGMSGSARIISTIFPTTVGQCSAPSARASTGAFRGGGRVAEPPGRLASPSVGASGDPHGIGDPAQLLPDTRQIPGGDPSPPSACQTSKPTSPVPLEGGKPSLTAPAGPVRRVNIRAVLFVGNHHGGGLDRLLQLLTGHIGVEAELEQQPLVLEPQLQSHPVECRVCLHPIMGVEKMARHPVVDLCRLVHWLVSSLAFSASASQVRAK